MQRQAVWPVPMNARKGWSDGPPPAAPTGQQTNQRTRTALARLPVLCETCIACRRAETNQRQPLLRPRHPRRRLDARGAKGVSLAFFLMLCWASLADMAAHRCRPNRSSSSHDDKVCCGTSPSVRCLTRWTSAATTLGILPFRRPRCRVDYAAPCPVCCTEFGIVFRVLQAGITCWARPRSYTSSFRFSSQMSPMLSISSLRIAPVSPSLSLYWTAAFHLWPTYSLIYVNGIRSQTIAHLSTKAWFGREAIAVTYPVKTTHLHTRVVQLHRNCRSCDKLMQSRRSSSLSPSPPDITPCSFRKRVSCASTYCKMILQAIPHTIPTDDDAHRTSVGINSRSATARMLSELVIVGLQSQSLIWRGTSAIHWLDPGVAGVMNSDGTNRAS